jgi:hypothetical protein
MSTSMRRTCLSSHCNANDDWNGLDVDDIDDIDDGEKRRRSRYLLDEPPYYHRVRQERGDSEFAIESDDVDKEEGKCYSFSTSVVASCYCMNALLSALSSGGPGSILKEVRSQPSECTAFFIDYSSSTALEYLTIVITVVVNKFMMFMIHYLVDSEYHTSVDKAQRSLVYKIFISLYFNMAVLVLLASGKSGPQPDGVQKLHIMQGTYSDLDAHWFGNIGTYFILTFIIQVSSPVCISLAMYYIVGPLQRAIYFPGVRSVRLYCPIVFDISSLIYAV